MSSPGRHREGSFLCGISRVELAAGESAELERLIREGLGWEYIFSQARLEGIAPFIHHHIKKLPAYNSLPENVKEWARQAYFQNLARNAKLTAAIKEVSDSLRPEGLDPLLLKGIYLAEHIYGDIGLRLAGDIDLMIRKSDLQKTSDVLAGLGYAEPLNIKETVAFDGITPFNSLIYSRRGDPFFIHLHWHLINSTWPLESYVRKMDMERVWARSESVLIDQATVRALSPEHQIIYLVNHGFHHFFSKLIVCADVREALVRLGPRIDPQVLTTEARQFGMEHILREGLGLVAGRLSCGICRKAAAWFGGGSSRSQRGYRDSYAIYFSGSKGVINKARFLYNTLFPQPIVLANSARIPINSLRMADYLNRFTRI